MLRSVGGREVRVLEGVPDPVVGPGEVLVRLRAAALNHLDVWIRRGLPSVPKPRILGADGAGVVAALGEGVSGFELGERVVINPGIEAPDGSTEVVGEHGDGTNAELIAIPATKARIEAAQRSNARGWPTWRGIGVGQRARVRRSRTFGPYATRRRAASRLERPFGPARRSR